MLRSFARLRLRTKLILAFSGVGAATAALACSAVLVASILVLEDNVAEDTDSLAQVIAQNSAGAVAFEDQAAGSRILGSLFTKDSILSGALRLDRKTDGSVPTAGVGRSATAVCGPRPWHRRTIARDSQARDPRP